MPHLLHTITTLDVPRSKFRDILMDEAASGRRIHSPRRIYNPEAARYQWHWQFRGKQRQLRSDQLEILMEVLNML